MFHSFAMLGSCRCFGREEKVGCVVNIQRMLQRWGIFFWGSCIITLTRLLSWSPQYTTLEYV
jgi:hypothetical protein